MSNPTRPQLSLGPVCQGKAVVFLLLLLGCQTQPLMDASLMIEAELLEVKGGIPEHLDYKYVFIMKYRVFGGDLAEDLEIYVGHPNPVTSRFVEGRRYRLALEPDLFTLYEGGVVNRYFGEDISAPYLAIDVK